MPIPILVAIGWGIAIVVGGTLGTAAVVVAGVILWDIIETYLKGRKIAVLGDNETGKTTLLKFLSTGVVPKEYKPTINVETVEKIRLSDLDLELSEFILKETKDVYGSRLSMGKWKELFIRADLVLYLVRADSILNQDTTRENRIRGDFKTIKNWLDERKTNPPYFFIIGTFADKIKGWPTSPEDTKELQPLIERFRGNDTIRQITAIISSTKGASKAENVLIGSLKDNESAIDLVLTLFSQLSIMLKD